MGSLNIELRYTTCSRLLLWSSVLLLLLLSQRLRPMPRLMLLSFTEPTDMPVSHTPVMPDMPMELTHMLTTERDLLTLSQRLMLTMDTTDMPDLMPMVLMVMVLMDVSGDKLNATQLRSSKANIKYQ